MADGIDIKGSSLVRKDLKNAKPFRLLSLNYKNGLLWLRGQYLISQKSMRIQGLYGEV